MGKLLGQQIAPYVISQIAGRQIAHGSGVSGTRSSAAMSLLNSKTAWVKMASSVILQDDRAVEENIDDIYLGKNLAKAHVLFAGTAFRGNKNVTDAEGKSTANKTIPRGVGGSSAYDNLFGSLNGMYNVNPTNERYTGFGAVPMPGIESVDVKAQNRGSIKDITVKMFAYSPEQFRVIDLLYLRLGYTMFIEWGWSIYFDTNSSPPKVRTDIISLIDNEEGFFKDNYWGTEGKGYFRLLRTIAAYRAQYAGNYDGVVAKVVNYDWTVDENGKYNITVKLKTLGDVIESLKTNLTPSQEVGGFINSAYKLFQSTNFDNAESTGASADKVPPKPFDNALSAFMFLQLLGISADDSGRLTAAQDVPCYVGDGKGNRAHLEGFNSIYVDSFSKNGSFFSFEEVVELPLGEAIQKYITDNYGDSNPTELKSKEAFNKATKPGAFYYIETDEEELIGIGVGTVIAGAGLALLGAATFGVGTAIVLTAASAAAIYSAQTFYNVHIKFNLDRALLGTEGQDKNDIVYINYNLLDRAGAGAKTINPDGLYLRLGLVLEYINKYIIPFDAKIGKKEGKIIKIDTGESSNIMYRIPYQISLDPRVCIVRNTEDYIGEGKTKKQYYTTLKRWTIDPNDLLAEDYPLSARTMNLYVNGEHINKIIKSNQNEKGDLNLFKFLSTLCDDINKALGGVNNLEPVIDEETNTINIIDGSLRPKEKENNYLFQVFGYNDIRNPDPNVPGSGIYQSNFVRNFDVKTELTNNLATMLSIGSTAAGYSKGMENTAFSRWNQGLLDPFKEKLEVDQDTAAKGPDNEELDPLISYKRDIWQTLHSAFGYTDPKDVKAASIFDFGNLSVDNVIAISNDKIDSNVAIGTEFYKFVNSRLYQISEKTYASPSQGFLPISFGLTMDGISGFKIYNSLNIDTRFLPDNYTKTMQFILKNVDHTIKNNDWETKVSTVMVAKEGIIREDGIYNLYNDYVSMSSAIKKIIDIDTSAFTQLSEESQALINQITANSTPPVPKVSAEAVADGDPAISDTNLGPAINPTKQGGQFYSFSPLAAQQTSNGQKNGQLNQKDTKILVFIGETQGANKRYINPATNRPEYMLHPKAAEAWYKWRNEMKSKGIAYLVSSAYRSVSHQKGLGAGKTVATAGSSPHGLGGALDFANLYRIVGGSGDPATNLEGRKTQEYYNIASIGAKYGWYNPHRLADNGGLDEIWHFEYWGPV